MVLGLLLTASAAALVPLGCTAFCQLRFPRVRRRLGEALRRLERTWPAWHSIFLPSSLWSSSDGGIAASRTLINEVLIPQPGGVGETSLPGSKYGVSKSI